MSAEPITESEPCLRPAEPVSSRMVSWMGVTVECGHCTDSATTVGRTDIQRISQEYRVAI